MAPSLSSLLQPHPILWQSGGFTLYTHALFFALGAEGAYLLLSLLAERRSLPSERLGYAVVAIFGAGLVGARLSYFLLYPSQFESISQVLSIWQGGLVSYGGMLAGLGAGWLLIRKQKPVERRIWFDLLCVVSMAAWCVGRLGNYYAADSVGVLSQSWNVFYGRVPIQLFESFLALLLAIAGWRLQKKWSPGKLGLYLIAGYLGGRFIIDIWRDEPMVGPFHLSQVVSLVLLPFLITLILRHDRAIQP